MRNLALSFVVIAAVVLYGCSGVPSRTQARSADLSGPVAPVEPPSIELDGELLYQILEAEIALQRKHFDVATARYLELAEETRDPRLAERAARVAVYARDDTRALKAARLWVELDAGSGEARQIAVVADIRNGMLDDALQQMEALLASHAASPDDGFKLIASLLSREEDVAAAYRLMGEFIEGRRDNPEALFTYAHLAMRAGDLEVARQAVERSLELRPDWVEAIALQLRILRLRGADREAADLLARAVERNPDDSRLRLMYARMLMDDKHLNEAITQYQILAEQMPENTDVLLTLGLIHFQLDQLDEAEKYLSRAEQIGGRSDEVQFYLGWLDERRDKPAAAMEHYASVLGGESFVEARVRMAVLMARENRLADARLMLHSLRTQRPEQQKRLFQVESEILRQADRNAEALEVLEEALEVNPGDFDLLYSHALLAEEMGMLEVTERDLRSVIERDPNNVDALNALGYTLADRTDRYDEAYEYVKRAFALAPQNNAVLDSMGWVLYRLGEYKEAIKYLRRSLELREDHEVAAHLGEVLWVAGEHEEAMDVWEQALERFPGDQLLLDVMKRFGQ